jgi:hypothetical protein
VTDCPDLCIHICGLEFAVYVDELQGKRWVNLGEADTKRSVGWGKSCEDKVGQEEAICWIEDITLRGVL